MSSVSIVTGNAVSWLQINLAPQWPICQEKVEEATAVVPFVRTGFSGF